MAQPGSLACVGAVATRRLTGVTVQRSQLATRGPRHLRVQALFGWDRRPGGEEDRQEQIRLQQEVLRRRRSNSWQKDVDERRAKVKRYNTDPEFKKQIDEDKRARAKAEREAKGEPPKWGIIVPLAPFGMPEYDLGERFDLRLPHVDNGWVDEDADMFKMIGNLFKGKKKGQAEDTPAPGKKSGKKT
ncbi:hypothetical protein WJX72_000880 [[Myrmecia] bisecta]|uniref:Uncharacterized protein n=1 Tax=[Myrmecia] bisecta TaxID=41462 RepID=A0AAW1R4D4_9CHLO